MQRTTCAAELRHGLDLLASPRSAKARAGAKALRRLADPRACQWLTQALEEEIERPERWETKYHLIMALGTSGCMGSMALLEELSLRSFNETMIYVAVGDATARLSSLIGTTSAYVSRMLTFGNVPLAYGALQAVASSRMVLDDDTIAAIIGFASESHARCVPTLCDADASIRHAVAYAAAGWDKKLVSAFLDLCLEMPEIYIRETALASKEGNYHRNWRAL